MMDINVPLPLQFEWSFSYDEGCKKGANKSDYESSLKSLGVFSCVQDFWRYWNNMMMDGSENQLKFPEGANLRMFKSGIVPSWEDPANAKGGKWIITLHKEHSRKVWAELVLLLIGDQLEICEDLCGVVFAIRSTNDTIALWNRNGSDTKLIEAGSAELKERLSLAGKTAGFEYKPHQVSMDYNRSVQRAHRRQRSTSTRKSPRLALTTSQDEFSEESDQFDSACTSGVASPSFNSPRLSRTSSHEARLSGMASPQPLRAGGGASTSVSGKYLTYLTIAPDLPPSSVSPSYSDSNVSGSANGGATTPPLLSNSNSFSASTSSLNGNGNHKRVHSRRPSDVPRTISPSASSGAVTPPPHSRASGNGTSTSTAATAAISSSASSSSVSSGNANRRYPITRARSDVGGHSASLSATPSPAPSTSPSSSLSVSLNGQADSPPSPPSPEAPAVQLISPRETVTPLVTPTPTPIPNVPAPSRPSRTSQQRAYKELAAQRSAQPPVPFAAPLAPAPPAAATPTAAAPALSLPLPAPVPAPAPPLSPSKRSRAAVAPVQFELEAAPQPPTASAPTASQKQKKQSTAVVVSPRTSRSAMVAVFFALLFLLCIFTYGLFVYGVLDSTPLRRFADVFRMMLGSRASP